MTQSTLAFRIALVVGLAGLATACAPPAPGDALLRELDSKQFFKYAGPNADKVRGEIKEKGWPALFGDSGRVFGADGLWRPLKHHFSQRSVAVPTFCSDPNPLRAVSG